MSNRSQKNVKRFIEIISKNVADDAYHGGDTPEPIVKDKFIIGTESYFSNDNFEFSQLILSEFYVVMHSNGPIKAFCPTNKETPFIIVENGEEVYSTVNFANGKVGTIINEGQDFKVSYSGSYYGGTQVSEFFYVLRNKDAYYLLRSYDTTGFNSFDAYSRGSSSTMTTSLTGIAELSVNTSAVSKNLPVNYIENDSNTHVLLPYEINQMENVQYNLLSVSAQTSKYRVGRSYFKKVKINEIK